MAMVTVMSTLDREVLQRIALATEKIANELEKSNLRTEHKEPPPDNSWLNKDDAEDGTDLISYVNAQLKKRFRK